MVARPVNPHQERENLLKLVNELKKQVRRIDKEKDMREEFRKKFPSIDDDIKLHKDRLTENRPVVVIGNIKKRDCIQMLHLNMLLMSS